MSYIHGADRLQTQLLPPCVEDYVSPNAPARFIDAFVEGLDFQALGFGQAAATGRPPYHPGDLLKLYVYGYLHRIRSSRRLEAEASRNLELIWLLRGLRPDFKTIADFRKDNRAAFKALFKEFNLLCRSMELFGAELVAIDGSRFKAVNSSQRHYTQKELRQLIETVEERIDAYLKQMDHQDAEAEGVAGAPSREDLQNKIARLKERKGRYDELLGSLKTSRQKEASLTDPDSRTMKRARRLMIGYNVQVAVDAKHDLIVAQEVVQSANDRGQLAAMALAAQEQLAKETLEVVADKGYHQVDQLEACEEAGVKTFVPAQGTTSGRSKNARKVFPKEQFRYDAQSDTYSCPGGQSLKRGAKNLSRGIGRLLYHNRRACPACPIKAQCTTYDYRVVARRKNEAVAERAAARLAGAAGKLSRRREIVEHVFGSLRLGGHDVFLMKGLERVRAEFSLSALSYNLRRVLNLLGVAELLKRTAKMDLKLA